MNFKNILKEKILLKNISLLFVVQGSNYLLPLIAFPYLVRVLGVENFGLLALAIATANYFKILVNYGFDLSATKEVSENRHDLQKIGEIVSSVYWIKIFLFLLSLSIYSAIIFSFDKFSNNAILYYLTFFAVLSDILFPIWLFQGMEKMKFIAYLNFLSKLLFLISIFFIIKTPNDLILVPLLTLISGLFTGFIATFIILKKIKIKFSLPKKENIKYHFMEGWYMFQGLFSMTIINNSTIFVLGLFSTNEIVGSYAIAEKLIRAIKNITSPIAQASYPHLALLYKKDKKEAYKFSINLTLATSIVMFIGSIILIFFAENILSLLFGSKSVNDVSVISLQILSFFPLVSSTVHIFCTQNMIFLGLKKLYAKIYLLGSLFNIAILIAFIPVYGYVFASSSMILTEAFIGLIMLYYIKRKFKNDK